MSFDVNEKVSEVLGSRYKVPKGFMLPPDDSCFSRCEADVINGVDLLIIYSDVLRLKTEVDKSVKTIKKMLWTPAFVCNDGQDAVGVDPVPNPTRIHGTPA